MQFLSHLLLESLTTICSCNHHRRQKTDAPDRVHLLFWELTHIFSFQGIYVLKHFLPLYFYCANVHVITMCKLMQAKTYSSSRDNSIESSPRSLAKTSPRLIAKGLVKGRASTSRSRGRGEDIQPSKPVLRTDN